MKTDRGRETEAATQQGSDDREKVLGKAQVGKKR